MTLNTAGQRFYDRLAPVTRPDPANGMALEALVDALTVPGQIIDEVARDTDTHEAWTQAGDPDAAPEWGLPWLAQWGGTRLLPADTVQEQRDRIRQNAGTYRGTDTAVREATQRTLIGNRTVVVLHPSRWEMTVIVRTGETPDAAAAELDARSQKPVGKVLTFIVSDVPIIDEGGAARTVDAIGSAGTTIDAITLADWT